MSWGTCYAGSNNIHFDFPPIMADGRNYATWQPGAVINENITKKRKHYIKLAISKIFDTERRQYY